LWVDSAATAHNIRDRQSQADHRTQTRIDFPLWVRLLRAYNGYPQRCNFRQVTIGRVRLADRHPLTLHIP
jgi:Fe-S-cluster formation regulator IscX/YfhJ